MTPLNPALQPPVWIAAVDFTPDSIEVTFTNGVFAVYHAQLLFNARFEDHNGSTPVRPQD